MNTAVIIVSTVSMFDLDSRQRYLFFLFLFILLPCGALLTTLKESMEWVDNFRIVRATAISLSNSRIIIIVQNRVISILLDLAGRDPTSSLEGVVCYQF